MSSRVAQLLLVDDDPAAIQLMSRMLAQYPDQRFATSGEVALRLAHEAPPDLILLDADMPSMSGFEVCQAMKLDPALTCIPVIFATSHDTPALELAAFQSGAADFVSKPLVASRLTSRVRAQLRARQLVENLSHNTLSLDPALAEPEARAPQLLIVDDDVVSIHVLRHTLAAMGDLHFAKSGEEALQTARRLVPDLILLDAHMPDIDGFDVCRSLKAEAPFGHVPIAFLTQFSDPRYETRALGLGAADFITKPYNAAVLQARVRNLLELKLRTDAEIRTLKQHWRRIGDARIADIVSTASDAIVTYDADNKVVLVNAAACRMFGVESRRVIDSNVRSLLGDDRCILPRGYDAACTSIERANGVRLPVEMSVSSVGQGSSRLTTVMLRDISSRDRLETESRSRIKAETASRTKTMMMSYIAHEMGNPLDGLLGFARLMAADGGQPLAPHQAKRLEQIVTSGRHLQSLIRDVTDVSHFENGKLLINLNRIDAARSAEDAAAAVSALAEEACIRLCYLPVLSPSFVRADPERLHQCLINLLTNAIRYNQPGGWARIEVTSRSEKVAIAVSDNGMGMNAHQRQRLFEPFNRLDRPGAATPGTGLGLLVTRQLVEAMNGQLRVDTEAGLGSCFTIILPVARDVAIS
jgi:PAS domain S-box-containing protein